MRSFVTDGTKARQNGPPCATYAGHAGLDAAPCARPRRQRGPAASATVWRAYASHQAD